MKSLSNVRSDVILRLHSLMRSTAPGEYLFEIADHAVDLALSPSRSDDVVGFLYRNVLRDSRRILSRRHVKMMSIDAEVGEPEFEFGDHFTAEESRKLCAWPNPLEEIEAAEIEATLRERLGERGQENGRCLAGILEGENVEETARAVGRSPRHVKRTRSRIKHEAVLVMKEGGHAGYCDGRV
jgi:hypothetical protein